MQRQTTTAILVILVGTVSHAAQYQCENDYNPTLYRRYTRVPPNCRREDLRCPRSWKAGIPTGHSPSPPLIDVNFVQCHEGFLCCGYVPIDSGTGEVLGTSGVTVGSGVDLGSKTQSSLASIGVPSRIIDMLEPYFGLKQNDAACAVIERFLNMSCSDAQSLTEFVKNDVVSRVEQRYNRDRQSDTMAFSSLPRGIRTAIVDLWFQFDSPTNRPTYPTFWSHVIKNDWENAVKELRNFYGPTADPPPGDIIRRNNEADIIEATLAECNRSADIVFLLDESGSINGFDFQSSLNLVRDIINAFPDNTLNSANGTRFGLSTFATSYLPSFYLSTYTSKTQYFSALNTIQKRSGGTNLGRALTQIFDQFTEQRGLRPETFGFPKILIVLTDGQSSDSVSAPALSLRANKIVVYAIGIGSIDIVQLQQMASSSRHVFHLNSFTDLNEFAFTLTASSCYEPRPLETETLINGKVQENQFQYYQYDIPNDVNLMIESNDIEGNTLLYASRSNPHPYEHDSDLGFSYASQRRKVLVISPVENELSDRNKRQSGDTNTTTVPIYISVTGTSGDTSYTLVGSTCHPANCTEGTNEMILSSATTLQTTVHIMLFCVTVVIISNIF